MTKPGEREPADLDHAVGEHVNIGWRDASVNDTLGVRATESGQDSAEMRQAVFQAEGAGLQYQVQRPTLGQLVCQDHAAVDLVGAIELNDVRMDQALENLCFAQEAPCRQTHRQLQRQHAQQLDSACFGVSNLECRAESQRAGLLDQLVGPNDLSDLEVSLPGLDFHSSGSTSNYEPKLSHEPLGADMRLLKGND